MTPLEHARRARAWYKGAPRTQRCRQAARYAAAIQWLGNRWLLAHPINRKPTP